MLRNFFFALKKTFFSLLATGPLFLAVFGCQSPARHLQQTDRVAAQIIEEKQIEALGRTEPFSIETPANTLRRRLLLDHNLPYTDSASLGSKYLGKISHWPDDGYLERDGGSSDHPFPLSPTDETLHLSLVDALQVAARNSREYQSTKEDVFRSALALDLERDAFRNTFAGFLDSETSADLSGEDTVAGMENRTSASLIRRFETGVEIIAQIGIDLVKLLTMDKASSLGLFADASISIPLLRGAGRHIVAEPLTQAERDVVYAIWFFERFKRSFAVGIASEYLSVLQQLDQVQNAEENFRGLIASARRARRLADAGRLPEIQVDQAIQNELRARARWIIAKQAYGRRLDSFKTSLGLPPDANIELDRDELDRLEKTTDLTLMKSREPGGSKAKFPPADAPIVLEEMSPETVGPYELEPSRAIGLGLEHRLDLAITLGRVYDAQRAVVVAADALRAELNLLGSGSAGEGRSLDTAGRPDAKLRPEKGFYSALLSLDLPLERTAERLAFRNSYIDLEQAVRNMQELEDQVKLQVRNGLRDLLQFREELQIEAQSVKVAQRRVASTTLFLQAGRAQIRDLLEAQEDLITAQNALSEALVNYRVAELGLQRDMGLLQVNEEGLWQEFQPGETSHDEI